MPGMIVFVGGGVGDPDLVTVRGRRAIQEATGNGAAFSGDLAEAIARARRGEKLVRVIEGDVLSSELGAREVAEVARAGVGLEVIPAPSTIGVACAQAGIPTVGVTRAEVIAPGTLAERVGRLLAVENASTPAALIAGPLRPGVRTVVAPLGRLVDEVERAARGDAGVLVIGEGVARRTPWIEDAPLFGKRILVTRARAQASSTARALRARGAIPLEVPTIALAPPDDPSPLAAAVRNLSSYAVVAFTSANAVDAFFRALDDAGLDPRALGNARVAVIGPGTSDALAARAIRADLVAPEHRGEALAEAILASHASASASAQGGTKGSTKGGTKRGRLRVLLPRAQVARDALPDALRAAGAVVDVVAAYRTVPPASEDVERLRALLGPASDARQGVDAVLFTASSTVENFCALFDDRGTAAAQLAGVVVASIGPITSATCVRKGLRVDVEASPYTLPALLDALQAHFQARVSPD